jgi:hypothetical protein
MMKQAMNTNPVLFSVEEAFMRLGQAKGVGCLLIFNEREAIHVFVEDGMVVSVVAGVKSGEEALQHALSLEKASYRWIPDAAPPERTDRINIQEFVSKVPKKSEERFGKTIKMPTFERKEKKLDFQYFFIPEETPESRLRVRKTSNVVGREASCDLYIESFQVSRRHCLLQITDRGLLVKDLDSTNGTFVNGIPLTDGYINDGDRLSLGTYVMTLRREKL